MKDFNVTQIFKNHNQGWLLAVAALASGAFFVVLTRQGPGVVGRNWFYWLLVGLVILLLAEARFFCIGDVVVTGKKDNNKKYLLMVDGRKFPIAGDALPFQTRVYFSARSCYCVLLIDDDENGGETLGRGELNLIGGGRDEAVIEITRSGS